MLRKVIGFIMIGVGIVMLSDMAYDACKEVGENAYNKITKKDNCFLDD